MAASSAYLTDIATVIATGPTAATVVKANAAAGPIMDYPGNCKLVQLHLQECLVQLTALHGVTDAADSANKTLLSNLIDVLDGAGTPSTTLLTDIASVISTGPGALTTAACIAAAGPIMDYLGNCKLVQLRLQETLNLITLILAVTDSGDGSKATIQTLADGLV